MRGCLTLIVGFVAGVALMLVFWPRPPHGSATPGPTPDITLTLSDQYLDRVIAQRVAAAFPLPLQGIRVESAPPADLVVRAEISTAGALTPLTVDGRLYASGGHVRTQIVSLEAAGVPLPPVIGPLVSAAVDRSIARVIGGARVTGARVTPSGLQIDAQE